MAHTVDATLSTLYQQGQSSAIISWGYTDDSDGTLITPTSATVKLYDPNDVQRTLSDTAQTTSATSAPTRDTDGTVTGTIGKYYITVNFHQAALVGLWYVETTFTHENVPKTQVIGFNIVEAGASVSGDDAVGTVYVYCTPKDVENFLLLNFQNTLGDAANTANAVIQQYILQAEGEFEQQSGTAYRPVTVFQEMHDVEATRTRHRELWHQTFWAVPRPIHLHHKPVLPMDNNRGHKIEVYEDTGDERTDVNPAGAWTNYLTGKTYGRTNGDWWLDEEGGVLHIKKPVLLRRSNLVRVSYEYGKPIYKTTSLITDSATTIPMLSTHRYSTRGVVRINNEYIFHTGKTSTSLTGCTRGIFNTTAVQHAANSEVYEVPDDIRGLVTMRAATLYLQNEPFLTSVPEGGQSTVQMRIADWAGRWDRYMMKYQRWSVL